MKLLVLNWGFLVYPHWVFCPPSFVFFWSTLITMYEYHGFHCCFQIDGHLAVQRAVARGAKSRQHRS